LEIPQFSDKEFLDQTILNNAMLVLKDTYQDSNNVSFATSGLIYAGSLSFSFNNNLTVTVNAPLPFHIIFGNGGLANAEGTVDGTSTSTTTVDFTSLVPSSGSITAFIVAEISTIQQTTYSIVGPPPGHPDYDPNFAPTTAYAQTSDTLNIIPSSSSPNNTTSYELARLSLSSGQTSITSVDTSYQVIASSVLAPTGVVAGVYDVANINVNEFGQITEASVTPNVVFTNSSNTYTQPNTFNNGLSVNNSAIEANDGLNSGAIINISSTDAQLYFNDLTSGQTTPNKSIGSAGGELYISNSADNANILTLSDSGDLAIPGLFTANGGFTGEWSELPSGVRMLFQNGTAPTGWTQDTSYNDTAIRIMNGATLGYHGANGLSTILWGQAGGYGADSTTLSVGDMPSHNHAYDWQHQHEVPVLYMNSGGNLQFPSNGAPFGTGSAYSGNWGGTSGGSDSSPVFQLSSDIYNGSTNDGTTTATGGNGGHTHGTSVFGDLNVNTLDFILAQRN
jgi:hypothetical protein